jgi:hypothetical protein
MCGFEFENFTSKASFWSPPEPVPEAWDTDGELLHLIRYEDRAQAYRPDVWHNFPLGSAKEWWAGCLVEMNTLYSGTSVDERMANCDADLKLFVASCPGKHLSFSEMNRARLSWPTYKSFPKGSWQKLRC